MNEETLRVLEFDKVRQVLAGLASSEPGRQRVRSLLPLASREEVETSLTEISEMVGLLAEGTAPPVGGCRDLRQVAKRLRAEGGWLDPEALLAVLASLEAARDCRGCFRDREEAPLLSALAAGIADLKELRRQLRESLGPRGEILDGASFELGELRRDIHKVRGRIKRTLEGLLASEALAGVFQDRIITERDGRYVVPVRTDHRGRVKGFVHDESASGQTLFVEPAQVLENNNELRSLLRQEQREEERILRRLSEAVRRQADVLLENQAILARLDFVGAAGRFSRQCGGAGPRISGTPLIELRGARHPLLLCRPDGTLDPAGAVGIDLLLGAERNTLVISGPNTGGKTVAIKTLGLLLLMVRSGLHIPCRAESRVHLFEKIYADIGDEQSIEASLSTFSGHLMRIKRVLDEADDESLVLLDEIGTGTDPAEGGALALAVLDTLRERGARTVVTTHLNLVKGYAHLNAGVENAAVEFDSETLEPTYRLHYGIPGASSAFAIARRLGLAEEVLERANGYLDEGEREGLELVERLNRLRKELEGDLAEARILKERARQEREKRKRLLDELEGQKRAILEKASRRGEQLVREAEARLKDLLKEARGRTADARAEARLAGEARAVREDVRSASRVSRRPARRPTRVEPGELLHIAALDTDGEVVRVSGGDAELVVHGKKLRLALGDLEQYSPPRFAAKKGGSTVRGRVERERFEPKLLLVGKRVDAALPLLDRFLDDALLHGMREVEVVHGAGEGILRRAVREFLVGHRGVAAFHSADVARGGDNVTMVELRG